MKFKNRGRFVRKLKALPEAVEKEMRPALQTGADEINGLQRRFVPKEEGVLESTIDNAMLPEKSGRIGVELTAGGKRTTRPVRNGADAEYDYALGQEFGTKDMPANPFFFPGYRLGKKRAKSRITRAINKAAKRVAQS